MKKKALEIVVAIDEWIREIDSIPEVSIEYIQQSFESLRDEFDIPEDIAKKAVARALGELKF